MPQANCRNTSDLEHRTKTEDCYAGHYLSVTAKFVMAQMLNFIPLMSPIFCGAFQSMLSRAPLVSLLCRDGADLPVGRHPL